MSNRFKKLKSKNFLAALVIGISGFFFSSSSLAFPGWGWGPGPVFAGLAAGAAIGYMAASPGPRYYYPAYDYEEVDYYPDRPYPYEYHRYHHRHYDCRRVFRERQCFRDHFGRPFCRMVERERFVC